MAQRHIVRTVSVMTLLVLAVPMGAGQYPTVGIHTGALLATCEDAEGPVSWQNGGQDTSVQGACPGSETISPGYTTLACEANNLGNEICLVATSQGLECQWNAPNPPNIGFVTTYYAVSCKVWRASGSGGSAEAHSLNAAASGSIQVVSGVPTVDLRWDAYVNAVEVRQKYTTINAYEKSVLATWNVEGSFDSAVRLRLIGVGSAPVAWDGEASAKYHLATSLSVSTWTYVYTHTEIEVQERQAGMVGVTGMYVSTSPAVTQISWTGKDWGCDWLSVIEEVLGPREIGSYSTYMKTQAASTGEHEVTLQGSTVMEVTDQGSYFSYVQGAHGFTAQFVDGYDFASSIAFDVDYDHEWLPNTQWIDLLGSEEDSAGSPSIQVLLTESEGSIIASLVTTRGLDHDAIETPIVEIGTEEILPDFDLATAISSKILADDGLADGASFQTSNSTPCGPGTLESAEQPWQATGLVNGFSSGATKTKILDVEVFLDGFVQP